MKLIIKNDQKAFAELTKRYLTAVFRFSYSVSQNKELAEDVTQETFMLVWENAQKWEPSGQLKSWLFRVARNKTIDALRRIKPHTDIEQTHLYDTQKSPYSNVLDSQLNVLIDAQMAILPERQREAIMLVHFLQCSNIEAAETMEISVDALESLLARGRKKLRSLLADQKEIFFSGESNE